MRKTMTKTVVALYDDAADARSVESELSAAGFTDTEVITSSDLSAGWSSGGAARSSTLDSDRAIGEGSLAAGAPGVAGAPLGTMPGTTSALGRDSDTDATLGERAAGIGGAGEGIISRLRRAGVPEDDANVYAEGVRRGGSLVIARLADENVDRGLEIMSNYRPVDVEERGSSWRSTGWSRYDENAGPYTETSTTAGTGTGLGAAASAMRDVNTTTSTTTSEVGATGRVGTGEETVIPIVEEQIAVGKREVSRGGVRVRSYVVETPVEESVQLRDETVRVERRTVDRPVDATADAFRERTVEVTETDEEAVVSKTARVTGEVVISKDVEERTERISDTVRRTEVDVENATDANRRTDRTIDRRDSDV